MKSTLKSPELVRRRINYYNNKVKDPGGINNIIINIKKKVMSTMITTEVLHQLQNNTVQVVIESDGKNCYKDGNHSIEL